MKQVTFYCTEQQKKQIKALASAEGCSLSDFCLSKALGLRLQEQPETATYETKKEYKLKRRRKVSKMEIELKNTEKLAEEIISIMVTQRTFDNKVAIWKDGTWALVSCGYSGEQDGNNPSLIYEVYPDLPEDYRDWTYENRDEWADSLEWQVIEWVKDYIYLYQG